MEDLPSARPSCAGSDVTITSGSSPMVDFTSSFTIIEETTPPKDDVQHDRQLLQHKQNSPLHHPHNAKVSVCFKYNYIVLFTSYCKANYSF